MLHDILGKTEGVGADVAAGKSTETETHDDDRGTVVVGVVAAALSPVVAVGCSNSFDQTQTIGANALRRMGDGGA